MNKIILSLLLLAIITHCYFEPSVMSMYIIFGVFGAIIYSFSLIFSSIVTDTVKVYYR